METISDLNAQLEAARDAYYKLGQPIMTDAEYDALEKRLAALAVSPESASQAPVLSTVGSDITASGRVKHAVPMLSIENKYEVSDLVEWASKLPPETRFCMEPKFDGVSVELLYRDGKFAQALSRGTGTEGEDCTLQVGAVKSIPKVCATFPPELRIRGELIMENKTLERLNDEATKVNGKIYQSARNLTAGTMKLHDLGVVASRDIKLMPWDVLGTGLPDSGLERLQQIAKTGFAAPLGTIVQGESAIRSTLDQKLVDRERVLRAVMSLETDGVVLKVDSHSQRRSLGVSSKYTNWQVCFKPQSARGETHLREVIWQIGRQGKLTPVGIVDPINLAGAVITRVTLNNITWIRALGLKLNSRVSIVRSGDVIPLIEKVFDEEIE